MVGSIHFLRARLRGGSAVPSNAPRRFCLSGATRLDAASFINAANSYFCFSASMPRFNVWLGTAKRARQQRGLGGGHGFILS